MKYVKFSLVDVETGISVLIKRPGKKGVKNPNLEGLEVFFSDFRMPEWHYGSIPDTTITDPENENYEITIEEFKWIVKDNIENAIIHQKAKLYKDEIEAREILLSKYHPTAIIAGVKKYEEAVAYLNDNTLVFPNLDLEAQYSLQTTKELAEKIKKNYESFIKADRQISGIRSGMQKRLSTYVFDETKDPMESYNGFFNKTEKFGEKIIEDVVTDIIVSYYLSSILDRYTHDY